MGRRVFSWVAVYTVAAGLPLFAQSAAAPGAAPQTAVEAPAVQGGTITGTVKAASGSGKEAAAAGVPLPGVAITALNSLTGKKYTTATDVDGNFALKIPVNGRYVVRAELAAFATSTKEIVLNATQHEGTAAFSMELASRAAAREQTQQAQSAQNTVQTLTQGLQSLGVTTGRDAATQDATANAPSMAADVPSLGGIDAGAGDAVAVSGQMGQTNGLANFSEDDIRDRINDAVRQARERGGSQTDAMNDAVGVLGGLMMGMPGGGPGGQGGRGGRGGAAGAGGGRGGRGGGGGGFGGSGAFRGFNPAAIHGALYYQTNNAALDATPYSLTGTPLKPAYSVNHYGASFAGSPYIPGLIQPNLSQFVFVNFTGEKNTTPQNLYATVPTLAMHNGDFSGLTQTVNGQLQPVTLYHPGTNIPYTNNDISAALDTNAKSILDAYFPLPNLTTPTQQGYNYQRIVTAATNTTQISTRYVKNFGMNSSQPGGGFFGNRNRTQQNSLRQNMNVGFNYQHQAADSRARFVASDYKTETEGYGLNAGYTIGYGRFNANTSVSWNRSHSLTSNLFTYGNLDPGASLNIPRAPAVATCFYCGLPTISLTNFSSLSSTSPQDRIQQTISFNEGISWRRKGHNFRFGFNLRRLHHDLIGGNNSMSTLTFTGYATRCTPANPSSPTDCPTNYSSGTGAAVADYLLGDPQGSKIQAGLNKTYLREWIWDSYAQDDWRVLPNLTLNLGLRYEYFAPYIELHNELVNLDHNSDFTQVASVQPDQIGPFTGRFPRSLVNPDRTMFSPRFGFAWTPKHTKGMVVRGGYGINFNTSQYGSFAGSISFQQPFAITQTNTAATQGCGTFATGYKITSAFGCTTSAVQNSFAINRDYRLARVHIVNLDIQKTWPLGIVTNVGYNGSFSNSLDVRRAPNHTANGVTTPNATAFTYEDSNGASRFHSLSVNARKRMSRGVGLEATYQYGHSIDNAFSVNGQGSNLVAQDDTRLDLEYGNSSFDVRHQVSGNFVYELPFGPDRAFLSQGGFVSKLLDGFSLSGTYSFATGTYFTPQYQGTAAQVASGANYTLRPDRVFSQPINGGSGSGTLKQWFNKAAFSAPVDPVTGLYHYGTASRNSIEGPGTQSVNMSLARAQRFTGTKSFEVRATASNVFNNVRYSGISVNLNSATFGQVTGVQSPRKITMLARFRF